MIEDDQWVNGATKVLGDPIRTSYIFKLTEIFKNLHSPELAIYSDASNDFISLLRGNFGGEVLREYVQLSPKCAEVLEAWRLHLGKPGMSFILSLVSVILSHPDGKSQPVSIRSNLDNVARSIIEDKLEDVYAELNSRESRRQSAALYLLGSIVRRRMGLASDVAKRFDFKIPVFSKLSGLQKKKVGKNFKHGRKTVTRRAFVEFAMSFLEVGNPRLLRWILQQRDMYSGVLRGLADDDCDTIIFVLLTLRDKVLTAALVPPGLRSVLFGSVTLEQLSFISGNQTTGPAADIAHDVLVMVCTDPCNGLMSGPGFKGNKKRLLDLTRKLKATEVGNHKKLLLAIVKGNPNLCSSYMDEFPYHLDPRPSSSWFSAISLAADLVSALDPSAIIATMSSHSCNQPVAVIEELHDILKCMVPRTFTRSVMNKGLLHSDSSVKHGSLRFIFESLKLLNSLIRSVDVIIESTNLRKEACFHGESMVNMHNLPMLDCLMYVDKNLSDCEIISPLSDEDKTQYWVSLKHYVQNEIRAELPDPQVLFKLLSSSSVKYSGIGVKRPANFPDIEKKKLKLDKVSDNIDIVIGGLDMLSTEDSTKVLALYSNHNSEVEKDHFSTACEIWGSIEKTEFGNKLKDADNFFHSKLLDVLKFYLFIDRVSPALVASSTGNPPPPFAFIISPAANQAPPAWCLLPPPLPIHTVHRELSRDRSFGELLQVVGPSGRALLVAGACNRLHPLATLDHQRPPPKAVETVSTSSASSLSLIIETTSQVRYDRPCAPCSFSPGLFSTAFAPFPSRDLSF
ncbi:hypothetical protein KSP40_PGU015439 [Platanthera guangdongensis]|uniref:URB1 N-terminal domain-containing protein n=1 Tax=Platanthera guangdongensis TaxID=2320717 RepID=A0ABR2ML98_9ASPA